jgi:hypothetical protein
MSQFDISGFLRQLDTMEGKITPVGVKKGLNTAQRDVPQMPALFKMKGQSPVLGGPVKPHPAGKYFVGDDVEMDVAQTPLEEAMRNVEEDMLSRVKKDLTHYLDMLSDQVKDQKEIQQKAVKDVEDRNPARVGDQDTHEDQEKLDEFLPALGAVVGRALVGKAARPLAKAAAGMAGHIVGSELERKLRKRNDLDEDPTQQEFNTEPVPTPIVNPTMPESASSSSGAPVVMIELAEGDMCEIYGDDQDGYQVRRGQRTLPTRFSELDHAKTAVQLWRARRAAQTQPKTVDQDYVDER